MKKKKKKKKMETVIKKKKVGRKKVKDKVQPVAIYIKASSIKKLGGADTIRDMMKMYINLMLANKTTTNE